MLSWPLTGVHVRPKDFLGRRDDFGERDNDDDDDVPVWKKGRHGSWIYLRIRSPGYDLHPCFLLSNYREDWAFVFESSKLDTPRPPRCFASPFGPQSGADGRTVFNRVNHDWQMLTRCGSTQYEHSGCSFSNSIVPTTCSPLVLHPSGSQHPPFFLGSFLQPSRRCGALGADRVLWQYEAEEVGYKWEVENLSKYRIIIRAKGLMAPSKTRPVKSCASWANDVTPSRL